MRLKVFLIGNQGPMSLILQNLSSNKVNIVGLCTRKSGMKDRFIKKTSLVLKKNNLYPFKSFESLSPVDEIPNILNIAKAKKIPIFFSHTLAKSSFLEKLKKMEVDIILVSGFNKIIKKEVIALPRIGIFNIHPSLLPKYRGGTPNRWVIRNSEDETGVSIHRITEKIDDGDVYLSKKISIKSNYSWGDLETKSMIVRRDIALEFIDLISKFDINIKGQSQDKLMATYDPPYNNKFLFVNFYNTFEDVRRQLLAIYPKSGVFVEVNNMHLCVYDFDKISLITNKNFENHITGSVFLHKDVILVKFQDWIMKVNKIIWKGSVIKSSKVHKKYKLN